MEAAMRCIFPIHPLAYLYRTGERGMEISMQIERYTSEEEAKIRERDAIVEKTTKNDMCITCRAWLRRLQACEIQLDEIRTTILILEALKIVDIQMSSISLSIDAQLVRKLMLQQSNGEYYNTDVLKFSYAARKISHENKVKDSEKILVALGSCSADVKQFYADRYWNCLFCKAFCPKEHSEVWGAVKSFPQDLYDNGLSQHFVCFACMPEFVKLAQTVTFDATHDGVLSSFTSDGSVVHELSSTTPARGTAKKKKIKKKRISTKDRKTMDSGEDKLKQQEIARKQHASSPSTVVDFPPPPGIPCVAARCPSYPSNEDLLEYLSKTGSIIALNEYLDELVVAECCPSDTGISELDYSILEEYRNQCVEISRQ